MEKLLEILLQMKQLTSESQETFGQCVLLWRSSVHSVSLVVALTR